jgi:hypothetical protein
VLPRRGRHVPLASLLEEWRKQSDILAAVHGQLHKVMFLIGAGEPALVQSADVMVGLIEARGARPRCPEQCVGTRVP